MAAFGSSSGSRPRKKLTTKLVVDDVPADVLQVRFSLDDQLVAVGCGDGAVRFYTLDGRVAYTINGGGDHGSFPITGIRFRPEGEGARARNMLLVTSSDGYVRHWHASSQRCLHETQEAGNAIYAVDYRDDAEVFATAGGDCAIRIYDEATKEVRQTLKGRAGDRLSGHSSRVFCVRFSPSDPNILVSGGWDDTLQVWDLREANAIKLMHGPHICGNAIDICGDSIVTGSWRESETLQLWSIATGALVETIPWGGDARDPACFIYSAQFSKDGAYVVAGGSGLAEARVFDSKTKQLIGRVDGMTKGVYSVAFSPSSQYAALGCGDNSLRIVEMKDSIVARP
eukprot:a174780_71.p1 GENE.a174780_71~~a174780_71.p1  ORF type:complete len:352 (-),score=125.04 a174780_71:36-1058(-)